MKVDVQEPSAVERIINVEIPVDRVEQGIQKALKEAARTYQFHGFRKGKAPLRVVERYIKRDVLLPQVVDDLVPEVYNQILEEHKLRPLTQPKLDLGEVKAGEPVSFTAAFQVVPAFELPDPTIISVEARRLKVDDPQVDEEIEQVRQAHARLVKVEEDRPLQIGDEALVDFESTCEGKPVERGASKDFHMTVNAESYVPGLVDNIVGMKPGEERSFTVTFPENYGSELAGKDVDFHFKLQEIKTRVVPEANDDLAREAGHFETLAALREDLGERMKKQAEAGARSEARSRIWSALVEKVEVPMPPALVQKWTGALLMELARQLAMAGRRLEQYLAETGKDLDAIKEELRPRAELMAKEEMVLDAVSRQESIEVGEEEVLAEINAYAARSGQSPGAVRKKMEDEGNLGQIYDTLLRRKVLDFLLEKATVTWREVTPQEFEAEEEAARIAAEAREHEHEHEHAHDHSHEHDHAHEGEPASAGHQDEESATEEATAESKDE